MPCPPAGLPGARIREERPGRGGVKGASRIRAPDAPDALYAPDGPEAPDAAGCGLMRPDQPKSRAQKKGVSRIRRVAAGKAFFRTGRRLGA